MTRSRNPRSIPWLVTPVAMLLALVFNGCAHRPQNPELGITIVLQQDQDPVPKSCKVSRSQHQDHIRWDNRTGTARTLTFQTNIWPFVEDAAPIVVPANGMSAWYTVRPDIQNRPYTYGIDPPLKTGPPTEPDISGQD